MGYLYCFKIIEMKFEIFTMVLTHVLVHSNWIALGF
jgi:hypothetical protein